MTQLQEQWQSPPAVHKIGTGEVHVWRSRFHPHLRSEREFAETLSPEELARAQKFVRQSDRDRYIFSHGLLRKILSAYLSCKPQQLKFSANPYGKPFLTLPGEIRFNLSHSHDMTLIAIARGIEIGIDVEYMRTIKDARQIANRFFSTHERRFLNLLPAADFDEAFFALWTLKEAFLKGIGKGLSYPLDGFSIIYSGSNPKALIFIDKESGEVYGWKVMQLLLGPGYSGALAMGTPKSEPKYFEYGGN